MNYSRTKLTYWALVLLFPSLVLVTSTGCIQQWAQLLYVIKGHEIPAKYSGLEGKKIAIVCVSDQSAYGPDTLTYTVASRLGQKLAVGLPDSEIIAPKKVEDWMDENGWEAKNVVEMGTDLEADVVVVVEVSSYSIRDGATLFKGSADVTTTVYDIEKDGQVSFVDGPNLDTFPENGRASIQTTDRKFEAFYLAHLTDRLSKLFLSYDKMEAFAENAMMN